MSLEFGFLGLGFRILVLGLGLIVQEGLGFRVKVPVSGLRFRFQGRGFLVVG